MLRPSEETSEMLREIGIGPDDTTLKVLMLGYMNKEAFEKTAAARPPALTPMWTRASSAPWLL